MPSLFDLELLLTPVSAGDPAGPDLEYDSEFLALVADANAISKTRPPNTGEWQHIANRLIDLTERTKDLRVAVLLTRALVITEGWPGLASGLRFLRGLLDRYWMPVHPRLEADDDNDPTWRLNVLADLGSTEGIIADLVAAPLIEWDANAVSLEEIESAYETATGENSKGVDLVTSLEIRQKMQSASENSIRATLEAVFAAAGHLAAIEAILAERTQRPTDQFRRRLADVIGRARQQLEISRAQGDLVATFTMEPDRNLRLQIKLESMKDLSPEEVADAVPILKELLETREKLSELMLERPDLDAVAGDAATAEPVSPEPGTAPDESAHILDENVQFTVYRPRAVVASRWHTLLAFAHLAEKRADAPADEPDPIEDVRRQAMSLLGEDIDDYQQLTDDSTEAIPADSLITFVPMVAGVDFNPTSRSFRWTESVHRESFRMRAGAELAGQRARGRLSVYLGSILIGDVSLSFKVDADDSRASQQEPAEPALARPYRKIFPSYAHTDTAIVEQFERFARSFGDSYLRDVTTLRAGEVWDDRIGELIAAADVFQLFWSTHSMASPFVQSEWERAVALERPNFVRPVYWEDPLPGRDDLPPRLGRLHFQLIAWAEPAATAYVGSIVPPSTPSPRPAPVDRQVTQPGSGSRPASTRSEPDTSRSSFPVLPLVIVVVVLVVLFFLFT